MPIRGVSWILRGRKESSPIHREEVEGEVRSQALSRERVMPKA